MERERLESAATDYVSLRGLLMVPMGILLALSAMTNLEWGPFRHLEVFWAATAAALAAGGLILRHYYKTYGRIVPSRRTRVRSAITTVISVALVVGVLQASWSFDLPVSGGAIAFALMIQTVYIGSGARLRPHQVIACGALLVAGLLPLWGGVTPDARFNVGLILAGAVITTLGILDHAALKRAFAPPAADLNLGNADAEA